MIFNLISGSGAKSLPEFTYSGAYTFIDDGDKNWRIKFTTSGTLRFSKLGTGGGSIDVFCRGGGANGTGGVQASNSGAGGGGGYTKSETVIFEKGVDYAVVVGAAGSVSSVNGVSANGGSYWNGGSGGGGQRVAGGTDGASASGTGQGYSTREFWELDEDATAQNGSGGGAGGSNEALGGGAGGAVGGTLGTGSGFNGGSASANTGGGGGGGAAGAGYGSSGGAGGSGIVIIRNHREVAT